MMRRIPVLMAMLALLSIAAWGQGDAPPPPPALPVNPPGEAAKPNVALPDMKDPAAVAAAYGEALRNLDGATALALIATTPQQHEMLARIFEEFRRGPDGMDGRTAVRQFLLVPVFGVGDYAAGKADVKGDTAKVPVAVTITTDQQLVLKKQPDGTWRIDLDETCKATTGQPAFFLREPEMVQGPGGPQAAACMSNLKQLGLAAMMFAADHDETLPSADKWTDELQPYLGNAQILKCPAAADLACGYAINAKVAGKKLGELPEPWRTVLFFESTKGVPNSADAMESLVPDGRHNGGNSFVYTDGHAQWVLFGQDPEAIVQGGVATRGVDSGAACTANLRSLAAAALRYAHDHEGMLPTAGKWADELAEYVTDPSTLRCLDEAGLPGGYALNARVAGRSLADIADPETTVLFFETTSGDRNATDPLDSLVPEGRHHGGSNFAYADGHVNWVKVGQKP